MFGLSTLFVKHVDLVAAADIVVTDEPSSTPTPTPAADTQPQPAQDTPVTETATQERTVEAGRANRRTNNSAMKEAMKAAGLMTDEAQARASVTEAIVPSSKMKLFTKMFDQTTRVMEYDRRWANGTGYFDGLVNNPDAGILVNLSDAEPTEEAHRFMMPGEMAKAVDDHGRRMIIVATRLGPVVVFERFSDGKNDTLTFNASFQLTNTILVGYNGGLDEEKLERIIGDGFNNNIGKIVEEMFTHLNKATQSFFEEVNIEEQAPTMASVMAENAAVHH